MILAVGSIAITLLLFYRFVERRHKVIVAKLLGVGLGLALLAGGIYLYPAWRSSARYEQAIAHVAVTYLAPDTVTAAAKQDSSESILKRMRRERVNPFDQLRRAEQPDTVKSIAFRVCNNGPDTVFKVSFEPKRLRHGRSTIEQVIVDPVGLMDLTPNIPRVLQTDHILAPDSCVELVWSGNYMTKDSVFARVSSIHTERPVAG
jgi:hypothetical protein